MKTEIAILKMAEKWIRRRIFHLIHRYVKANNKYMKDYNKDKEYSYSTKWDVNNLYWQAVSQKLPGHNFEWKVNISSFVEKLIKKLRWK